MMARLRPMFLSLKYMLRDSVVRSLLGFVMLLVLVVIGLELAYLQPQAAGLQNDKASLQRLQQKIVQLEKQKSLDAQYDTVAPVVDDIDTRLSRQFGQSELTRALDRLSANSGADIVNINSRRDEPVSGYIISIHELSLKGNYLELRRFMSGFDMLPGVNLIEALSIVRTKEGGDLSISMRLKSLGGGSGGAV